MASGLVQAERVDAVEIELAETLDRDTTPGAAWDKGIADRLVKQGILTRFQAREILAGRHRFRLGQYTVLDEIGHGGMGQVFLAEHALMGRAVAVKVLPRSRSSPEYEAAFRREIRLLSSLDHENLVRALDAGYDAKVYYLVTEFVPGFDLRKQVQMYGPLEVPAAGAVMTQAARGLAYAHDNGVVHRDVKPGNLLVTQDGRVKVLDLGLAGSAFDPEQHQTGRVVGTMDYMAPEQIRAPESAGPPADVYALGCTLYFALAGRPPFPGGSRKEKAQRHLGEQPVPLLQIVPSIDPGLARLVEAMMCKDPADRVASAHEVIDRLRPWTPATPVPMSRIPVTANRAPGDERERGSSGERASAAYDLLGGREGSADRSGFAGPANGGGPPPLPDAQSAPIVVRTRGRKRKASGPDLTDDWPLWGFAKMPLVAGGIVCILTLLMQVTVRDSVVHSLGPIASPLLFGVGAGLLAALGQAVAGLFENPDG